MRTLAYGHGQGKRMRGYVATLLDWTSTGTDTGRRIHISLLLHNNRFNQVVHSGSTP